MTTAAVVFTPAADIAGAPRCPHMSGSTGLGTLQCEKEADHHLADYPGSEECASRKASGHWTFWKVARRAVTLTCLSPSPDDPRVLCSRPAGHDHTSTRVRHATRALHGRPEIHWIEEIPAVLVGGRR